MKKLETYPAFPIVAWTLVIGFSYFVYTVTIDVREEINFIAEQSLQTQTAVANQAGL